MYPISQRLVEIAIFKTTILIRRVIRNTINQIFFAYMARKLTEIDLPALALSSLFSPSSFSSSEKNASTLTEYARLGAKVQKVFHRQISTRILLLKFVHHFFAITKAAHIELV